MIYLLPELWTYPYGGQGERLYVRKLAIGCGLMHDWIWTPVRRLLPGIYIRDGQPFNLDARGFVCCTNRAADVVLHEQMERAKAKVAARGREAGGHARAAKLSPQRRSEIARKAAQARWSNGG